MLFKSASGASALSAAVVVTLLGRPAMGQLRAFGEAEGYGAVATGGRAATSVYHVTNLNDSGVGSLRDAVSGSNRIVVFDVAGEIKLTTGISAQGNITIAGQTAPGAGITITGAQAIGFTQRTNIIARYLRMRPGDASSASDNGMSMTQTGTAILDHVSIEFGKYNNIDAVAQTADLPRITIQNSIIADPISTGTDTRGQGFGSHLEAVNGFYTLSNNLWSNSHSRNPLAKVNDQFKNNVEYNNETGYLTSGTSTAFKHDLVNNAFIGGPDYTSSSDYGQLSTPDKFYAVGNVQDANRNGIFDPTISNPSATNPNSATPYHASTLSLPTLSVNDAYAYVLAHAGVSQVRDDLDNLVVGQVQTLGQGTSGYTAGTAGPVLTTVPFDTVHEGLYWKAYLTGLDNGGLGTTASTSRPANFDVDKDGIADAWEAAHGLNPALASDAFKLNPLGYLMVEQYINELGSTNDSRLYTGGAVSAAVDYGLVRGTFTANGNATLSSGTTNLMKLSIGGNGPAAGETMTVNGTGNLSVYDTIVVGDQNNAGLNIAAGTVSAYNVIMGNTVYSPAAVDNLGTINFSGGTLNLSQLVLGAGSAGAWTRGGSMTWTGGTLKAAAILNVNVPIALGASGGTVDSNGYDGTISGTLFDVVGAKGAFTKLGAGTITLSGTNTYTGVTKISAGTLAIPALANGGVAGNWGAASNAAANLVLDGGILKYAGTTTTTTDRLFTLTARGGTLDAGSAGQWQFTGTGDVVQSGTGNRTLTLTGSTTNSNFNSDLGDPTSGKTSLLMAGSGTSARWLIGASASPRTYSGDTTVTAGTLLTNANNVLPFGAGKGNLVITAGTVELNNNNLAINGLTGAGTLNQRGSGAHTLTLGNGDATAIFTGTLADTPTGTQGSLSIVKVGLGTQTLSGTATHEGSLIVQSGVLQTTSAVTTQALANAGGVDVQNGRWVLDYTGGTTPLAQVKTLLTSGYANGFTTGQIRNTTATSAEGLGYADNGTNNVTVMATLYGDANLDGAVDFNDFLILQNNFGVTGTRFDQGNFNYDNVTDFNDFLALQNNFGKSVTGAPVAFTRQQIAAFTAFAESVGVPEPGVGGAMVIGLAMLRRRVRA